jgi:polysaccharide biosynthesis/export protein
MSKQLFRAGTLCLALLVCAGGCSSSGRGFSIFPNRQPLVEEAKAVRQTAPLDLPRELKKALLPTYVVEPGDGLLILPSDLESPVRIASDQPVLPDGSIDLGKYGRLIVAGHTVADIEKMVNDAVKKEEPKAGFIDVRLTNRQSKVYYVLGEVNTPGRFQINGSETVLDGIIAAGGLNDQGSWWDVILVRPGPVGNVGPDGCVLGTIEGGGVVLAVRYARIVQLGDTSTNYQLLPGDRIFVPSRSLHETLFGHKRTE